MRRSKKKGFTLTEVLLAMAVIGVISAVVVPQIVHSSQKNKSGIILGKAVEQIELGCQNMIQDYNNRDDAGASMADTLLALDGRFQFNFLSLLQYIGATLATNGNIWEYRFNKFPAEVRTGQFVNQGNDTHSIIMENIVIDVNGFSHRPNLNGRDRFVFDLRNDGKLIPRGINVHTCDGDNPTVDENCTARVVKDGFKIKYNW